jgi:hypothetical protein
MKPLVPLAARCIDRSVVALRLYDTPVGVATRTAKDAPMPSVSQGSCR